MPEQNQEIGHVQKLVHQQAQCLISANDVQKAVNNLAEKMNKDLQLTNPLILIVMTGGVVFAGQLLPQLNFPLEVDFCQVSRYRSGTQSGELQWLRQPTTNLQNRTLIIVDDIYDEGTTLLELIEDCHARGATQVVTCVLVNKIHNRKKKPDFQPDYVALEVPDKFLVGYGMDYQGYGRNLPGLYTID
jgi:hypoxanthine phosphoribosyltransferase